MMPQPESKPSGTHPSRPNPLGLQPIEADAPYVFISYSREDIQFVRRFAADLQVAGVNIWIDQIGLNPGTPNWDTALRDAVRGSTAFLLIASPHSRASNYVADEIALARMYNRPIFPIWANGDAFIDSIPMGMGRTQYIDARGDKTYTTAISLTVEAIGGSKPEYIAAEIVVDKKKSLRPQQFANPYKGLEPFRAIDRELFFGRTKLVEEMCETLKGFPAFLGILGASGSGKSSVMMAGLLPALADGALPDSKKWKYLTTFTPTGSPLERLAEVLAQALPSKSHSAVRDDLDHPSGQGLIRLARQVADLDSTVRVVVYVDQFEELYTQARDPAERDQFIQLLTTAATDPESLVTVLMSLRADFYDRVLDNQMLAGLLQHHQTVVSRMGLAELYEAVRAPAAAVGVAFEDGLVSDIVFAVREEPGALPLLQFTLSKLYEKRDKGILTRAAYNDIGQALGALAQHAETTYADLPSDEHRLRARDLFLKLVTIGDSAQETTRRRARLSELNLVDAAQRQIINEVKEAFVTARLIVTDRVGDDETFEISHEALLRRWERLQTWVHDAREDVVFGSDLAYNAEDWDRRGRPHDQPERLYQFSKLREAQDWATRNLPDELIAAFLQASIDYEAEQERLAELRKRELQEATERAEAATTRAAEQTSRAEQSNELAQREKTAASRATTIARVFLALATASVIIGVYVGFRSLQIANDARRDAATRVAEAGEREATATVRIGEADQREATATSRVATADVSVGTAVALAETADKSVATADARVTSVNRGVQTAAAELLGANRELTQAAEAADEANKAMLAANLSFSLTATQVGGELAERLASERDFAARSYTFAGLTAAQEDDPSTAALLSILALRRAFVPEAESILNAAIGSLSATTHIYRGFGGRVYSLDVSRDGRKLLTGDEDGSLKIWSLETYDILHQETFGSSVYVGKFSPDGSRFASYVDGVITQWNSESFQLTCQIPVSGIVNALAYSPNGRYLGSGDNDGNAYLWDASDCHMLRSYTGAFGTIGAVAFSPDGTLFATGSYDAQIRIYDVASAALVAPLTLQSDAIRALAFSPDGRLLASGSQDRSVVIWDLVEAQVLHHFSNEYQDAANALAFSPDGSALVAGSLDGMMRVYSLSDFHLIHQETISTGLSSVAFTPDGKTLLAGTFGLVAAYSYPDFSPISRELVQHNGTTAYQYYVAETTFSADGQQVITAGDNAVMLWDTATGRFLRTLAFSPAPMNDAAISRDGRYVAIGGDDNLIRLWDLQTGGDPRILSGHSDDVVTLAFSPDGTRLASGSGSFDGSVRIWDTADGALLSTLYGLYTDVLDVAFTPDGRYVIGGSLYSSLIVWDVNTGEPVRQFYDAGRILTIAVLPDSRAFFTGDDNGYVSLWDIDTGGLLSQKSFDGAVWRVAVSPNGQYVFIGSDPGRAEIYPVSAWRSDTELPAATRTFYVGSSYVRAAAFSPDNQQMVLGYADGSVGLWYVDPKEILRVVCDRLAGDLDDAARQRYSVSSSDVACPPDQAAVTPASVDVAASVTPTPPTWTPVAQEAALAIPTPTPTNEFEETLPPTYTPEAVGTAKSQGDQSGIVPFSGGQSWTYEGLAGQQLRIRVRAANPANLSSSRTDLLDSRLLVYAPSGDLLAESDDMVRLLLTDSLIADLTLPVDGTYRIVVRSWADNSGGAYSLEITLLPTPTAALAATLTATPSATRGILVTDTPIATPTPSPTASATLTLAPTTAPVLVGAAKMGDNPGNLQPGMTDGWILDGTEGEAVTVSVTADWDTFLELDDASGNYLESDDDSLPNFNSQLFYVLPYSGSYLLKVSGFNNATGGEYVLNVRMGEPPEPTATPTPIYYTTAQPGDNIGSVPVGGSNAWTVEGQAGEVVTISAYATWDTSLTLYDESGGMLAFDDDSLPNLNSRLTVTLPYTGTYTILVASYGGQFGGAYTLNLVRTAASPTASAAPP